MLLLGAVRALLVGFKLIFELLYLLGRPVPAYCDGRPLTVLFQPDFVKAHPVQVEKRELDTGAPEDTAAVPDAMKGLGYIN